MGDAVARGSAMVDGELRYDKLAHKLAEENIKQVVIAAYTNALKAEDMRHSAFNAALRVYRMRHPGISEAIARRRVAQIICFAVWRRPERGAAHVLSSERMDRSCRCGNR